MLLCSLWACGNAQSSQPPQIAIRVPLGESVDVDGIKVSFNEIREDSRCPRYTTCVWEGRARVIIQVTDDIGNYVPLPSVYEGEGGKLDVECWVLEHQQDQAREHFGEVPRTLAAFEHWFGRYPFYEDSYKLVVVPYLGMEHQTIIAYGNKFRESDPDYDWLHHHELAHEWWGNMVSCSDWKDMWIHEGFGTYMQALYLEDTLGKEGFQAQMLSRSRFGNRAPVAPKIDRDSKQIYFGNGGGNDIYNTGQEGVGNDAVWYHEPSGSDVDPERHKGIGIDR